MLKAACFISSFGRKEANDDADLWVFSGFMLFLVD